MQSADCILSPMQSADCAGSQIACNMYTNTLKQIIKFIFGADYGILDTS